MISRCEFGTRMTPLGFFVHRGTGQRPERPNRHAIGADRCTGDLCAWRLIHERHEFIREAGHRTANTNATNIRTPSDPRPSSLASAHCSSPPVPNSRALRCTWENRRKSRSRPARSIRPVAAFMNGLSKQPRRPQLVIERNHRSKSGDLIEQVQHSFHEVVRLDRTARNIHDRKSRLGLPVPSEIVRSPMAPVGLPSIA